MIKGVIAGNFDVIHPGYIKMFKEASSNCDCLIVLLHADPYRTALLQRNGTQGHHAR